MLTPLGWLRLDALAVDLTLVSKSLLALKLWHRGAQQTRTPGTRSGDSKLRRNCRARRLADAPRRFGLGVSPATIRNTMSDLEEKGFLFHPHTSAGRIPTNKAYRVYVDSLLSVTPINATETRAAHRGAIPARGIADRNDPSSRRADARRADAGARRRARTSPRAVDAAPSRAGAHGSERLLMVLHARRRASCASVFVEVPGEIAEKALASVSPCSTSDCRGLTLGEIRRSSRLACATQAPRSDVRTAQYLSAGRRADCSMPRSPMPDGSRRARRGVGARRAAGVFGGRPSATAARADGEAAGARRGAFESARIRRASRSRSGQSTMIRTSRISPSLRRSITVGSLAGVIGVIGPTRMPYDKVISLVSHTSQLLSDLLD